MEGRVEERLFPTRGIVGRTRFTRLGGRQSASMTGRRLMRSRVARTPERRLAS